MFIHCPHCRYLIATDPRTGTAPERCPRCGRSLSTEDNTNAGTVTDAPRSTVAAEGMSAQDSGVEGDAPAPAGDSTPTPREPDAATDTIDITHATGLSDASGTTPIELGVSTLKSNGDATAAVSREAPMEQSRSAPHVSTATHIPGFLHASSAHRGTRKRARWPWLVLPLLMIVLSVQILLADRDRLAADAHWRPLLVRLCGAFRCSLPSWREPAAFTMLDRDVRPLSGSSGVLQARATFRNDARWAQPWPIVLLTLKDADGRTLGARALTPTDYLDAPGEAELAPGQSAQVVVHVREPGTHVIAFSFDFR